MIVALPSKGDSEPLVQIGNAVKQFRTLAMGILSVLNGRYYFYQVGSPPSSTPLPDKSERLLVPEVVPKRSELMVPQNPLLGNRSALQWSGNPTPSCRGRRSRPMSSFLC